ncbi:MAG: ZIP family metal transporter [Bryobacteraceae bacterium]
MTPSSGMSMPAIATLAAVLGAVGGLWITGARRNARMVVPFSGGLLIGVALFGLLPELAAALGWLRGGMLVAAGYLLLLGVDRYVYAVCPSCSHDHDHDSCSTTLHGFAAPLISATALHAFLDGWSISASQTSGQPDLRLALPLAVALHKIPEGIALGSILRVSVHSRLAAIGWCVIAELPTLLGGALAIAATPHLGARWMHYPLAVAGGCFLYLGYHAIHSEWRRRGAWAAAFVPAFCGGAAAAALQQGVRAIFR